jgi:hypothetical protein
MTDSDVADHLRIEVYLMRQLGMEIALLRRLVLSMALGLADDEMPDDERARLHEILNRTDGP